MNYLCRTVFSAALTFGFLAHQVESSSNVIKDQLQGTYGKWRSSRIGGGGYVMGVIPTSNPEIYYLYTDVGGLYRSDNKGGNWHMLHGALPANVVNQEPRSVVVDPRDPMRIIIATGQHWADHRGGIYVSHDGGRSFRFTYEAAFAGNGNERMWGPILAIDPNNPDTVIAASMQDGVFQSTDFGETWQHVGLAGLNPTNVVFDKTRQGRALLSATPYSFALLGNPNTKLDGGFYETLDSGATWTKIELPLSPFEVVQASEALDSYWLGVFPPSQVKRSDDQGHSWYAFDQGLPKASTPVFDENGYLSPAGSVEPSTFTALTAGSDFMLLGSGDGKVWRRGISDTQWSLIAPAGHAPDHWYGNTGDRTDIEWVHFGKAMSSLLVDPHDSERWWMSDWYMVWHSFDQGKNWDFAGNGVEITVIHNIAQAPDDPSLVHLGMCDNGYFRSTDGGETWEQNSQVITSNIKDVVVPASNHDRLFAIGPEASGHWYSNQVFVSDDRGVSWRSSEMRNLPAPEDRRINSIAVDRTDDNTLYVALAAHGNGSTSGVFISNNAGDSWSNISQGLPDHPHLFRNEIFHGGRELAISSDRSMVAISRNHSLVFYRTPQETTWQEIAMPIDQPNSVAADPFQAGVFILGSLTQGAFRSEDGGKTWIQIEDIDRAASHVAYDQTVEGRVAVGTGDGVELSTDHGINWSKLDQSLPNRIGNPIAFAGDRLVAGTSGSGMFWIPLTEEAALPVRAKESN